jgi:hypothetical protein
MSFDRRLREGLEQEAEHIEPDVARQLGAVEARARRGSRIGSATTVLAAAAIVVAVVLRAQAGVGPGQGGPSGSAGPTATSSITAEATPASYTQVAGTFTTHLDPSDPAVKRDGLGGTWTLRLLPDGEVFLTAPLTFSPGANGLSGVAFSLLSDRFRTNLFINGSCPTVGSYVWSRAGGDLTLTPVDEVCAIRRTLLSSRPWAIAP